VGGLEIVTRQPLEVKYCQPVSKIQWLAAARAFADKSCTPGVALCGGGFNGYNEFPGVNDSRWVEGIADHEQF
jgi:hypothetical protein